MKGVVSRKLRRVAGVYLCAAFAVLSVLSALYASRVGDYRTSSRYAYELSFEQTAAAVNALSDTLEKCRYATGELCHSLSAEAYAEACAAKSALSTLPFSTVEMEQTKSFLGTAGAFAHALCAREGEFSDDEREDILALSDAAAAYTALVLDMRGALGRGELEMDSRETVLQNVPEKDSTRYLSAVFREAEENFPQLGELKSLRTGESDPLPRYADTAAAKAAAAKLLGVSEELLREEFRYADGSVALSRGSMMLRADSERVRSLWDTRLVEESRVSEKRAAEKAREFLSAAGCGDMAEESREQNGNVLTVSYIGKLGDALCPDCRARVGVALDNCAIYSFSAPESAAGGDIRWPLSAEAAQAALPASLTPLGWRKIVKDAAGCYEFLCADGERQVRILVDAEYGRELAVEVLRG